MSNLMILGNAPLTMSTREIAELLEKQHGNIKISAERLSDKGVIGTLALQEFTHNGNTYTEYLLNKRDSLILVAQNCPEFTARIVDRWQELEAQQAPAFAIPQTMSEALRLAADLSEQNERLALERDQAVRTKAEIGSRREATAMATAASAKREAERLKHALGFSARHATILQVEDITGGDYDFAPLRRWCKANEVTPEVVPDKRYPKGVKAWPAGAWLAVYGVSLPELFPCEVAA